MHFFPSVEISSVSSWAWTPVRARAGEGMIMGGAIRGATRFVC